MAPAPRRWIAALLLASYGLISACGGGLHALGEASHDPAGAPSSSDCGHNSPSPAPSDHPDDCLICLVVGQGQLSIAGPTPASGHIEEAEAEPARPPSHRPSAPRTGGPRAPPAGLA